MCCLRPGEGAHAVLRRTEQDALVERAGCRGSRSNPSAIVVFVVFEERATATCSVARSGRCVCVCVRLALPLAAGLVCDVLVLFLLLHCFLFFSLLFVFFCVDVVSCFFVYCMCFEVYGYACVAAICIFVWCTRLSTSFAIAIANATKIRVCIIFLPGHYMYCSNDHWVVSSTRNLYHRKKDNRLIFPTATQYIHASIITWGSFDGASGMQGVHKSAKWYVQ